MPGRTHTEAALLKALSERAICTSDNSPTTPRTRHGKPMKWLLDIRKLFLNGDDLELVTEAFWDCMEDRLPFQIGGLEVGAVPLVGALIVKARQRGHNINGFIVRKSRKKSGLCNQIEGVLNQHPIVIVDDLANSGSSLRRVHAALSDLGLFISREVQGQVSQSREVQGQVSQSAT